MQIEVLADPDAVAGRAAALIAMPTETSAGLASKGCEHSLYAPDQGMLALRRTTIF